MSLEDEPRIVRDFWNIVNMDKYAWIPVWGEGRCGKTSLAMALMYKIYGNWNDVLNAIVFNLSQLIYKLRHGQPRLFPTVRKPVHMRVPVLLIDDFAAQCGKAKTQHEKSWDLFKGSFDTLGTRVGILLATMIEPTSPTEQLLLKYTHEVRIEVTYDKKTGKEKRTYKYDKCKRQQDYKGWKHRQKKSWIEVQDFDPIPLDVYEQYDEMRLALVDETFVAIEDSMVFDTVERAVKRMEPIHYQILRFMKTVGMVNHHRLKKEFGEPGLKAMSWLKSYGLAVPVRKGKAYYNYDITALGTDVLKEADTQPSQKSISTIT